MFIRQVKKKNSKDSKIFYQFTLVQAARVNGKVKQRSVLYLGSDPLLRDKSNREIVADRLQAKIYRQEELFNNPISEELLRLIDLYYEKYNIKYAQEGIRPVDAPPAADAELHLTNIKGVRVKDVKTFGSENLCKQVIGKLELRSCLHTLGLSDHQANQAEIGIIARAIFAASEHKTAKLLQDNSELADCYRETSLSHRQLYRVADQLFAHKETIDSFLYNKVVDLFNLDDNLVIFDITNTYFETRKKGSRLAKHGRSKEKRSDCPLVVFTGVINAEGFIRHSRIYEGNKADTATLDDMIADLEKHVPSTSSSKSSPKRTIVIDAGIATEENLATINEKEYKYVCVSRVRLKDCALEEGKTKVVELTDREKNRVELAVFNPEGYSDTWMYVQSEAKRAKEESMDDKLKERFIEALNGIRAAFYSKNGTKKIEKVWQRIGRTLEKHKGVSGQFTIDVKENEGIAIEMTWKQKPQKDKEDKKKGVYFIRTNYENPNEAELWKIYNTIREVEATFRCLKSELNIRPVHHQLDYRIESHIYLTILAYQLVNTIRHMLKGNEINHSWSTILRIMNTQTMQTIELPTDKKIIEVRKPSKPILEAQKIYKATGCSITMPAKKTNVVYH